MRKLNKMVKMLLAVTLFVTAIGVQNIQKVEAKTFTKTGDFSTALCTKDDKNEEFDSYAKKLVFKSNNFTLYGTMHYTKIGDVYSSKIYKKAKRTYVISSKCKFYKRNYKNGKFITKKISKKAFKKLILPLKKGSDDPDTKSLRWVIKNGVVTKMQCIQFQ